MGTGIEIVIASAIIAAVASYAVSELTKPPEPEGPEAFKDPGVKARVPTSTSNKLPVCYGRVRAYGTTIMADITPDNQRMAFLIAISEGPIHGFINVYWESYKILWDSERYENSDDVSFLGQCRAEISMLDGQITEKFDNQLFVAPYPVGGFCLEMYNFQAYGKGAIDDEDINYHKDYSKIFKYRWDWYEDGPNPGVKDFDLDGKGGIWSRTWHWDEKYQVYRMHGSIQDRNEFSDGLGNTPGFSPNTVGRLYIGWVFIFLQAARLGFKGGPAEGLDIYQANISESQYYYLLGLYKDYGMPYSRDEFFVEAAKQGWTVENFEDWPQEAQDFMDAWVLMNDAHPTKATPPDWDIESYSSYVQYYVTVSSGTTNPYTHKGPKVTTAASALYFANYAVGYRIIAPVFTTNSYWSTWGEYVCKVAHTQNSSPDLMYWEAFEADLNAGYWELLHTEVVFDPGATTNYTVKRVSYSESSIKMDTGAFWSKYRSDYVPPQPGEGTAWVDDGFHSMPNVAYAYVELEYESEKRVMGLTQKLGFEIYGRTVLTNSSAGVDLFSSHEVWETAYLNYAAADKLVGGEYSRDPAYVIMDYLSDKIYGAGNVLRKKDVDLVSLKELHDLCKEEVTLLPAVEGGIATTVPRFLLNGIVDTGTSLELNLSDMLKSVGCTLSYSDGQFKFITGSTKSSVATINYNEFYNNFTKKKRAYNQKFNQLIGKIILESDNYGENHVIFNIDDESRDNKEPLLTREVPLRLCGELYYAKALIKHDLLVSRSDFDTTFTLDGSYWYLEAGDVVTLTFPMASVNSLSVEILKIEEEITQDQILLYNITGREYVITGQFELPEYTDSPPPATIPDTGTNIPGVSLTGFYLTSALEKIQFSWQIFEADYASSEIQLWVSETPIFEEARIIRPWAPDANSYEYVWTADAIGIYYYGWAKVKNRIGTVSPLSEMAVIAPFYDSQQAPIIGEVLPNPGGGGTVEVPTVDPQRYPFVNIYLVGDLGTPIHPEITVGERVAKGILIDQFTTMEHLDRYGWQPNIWESYELALGERVTGGSSYAIGGTGEIKYVFPFRDRLTDYERGIQDQGSLTLTYVQTIVGSGVNLRLIWDTGEIAHNNSASGVQRVQLTPPIDANSITVAMTSTDSNARFHRFDFYLNEAVGEGAEIAYTDISATYDLSTNDTSDFDVLHGTSSMEALTGDALSSRPNASQAYGYRTTSASAIEHLYDWSSLTVDQADQLMLGKVLLTAKFYVFLESSDINYEGRIDFQTLNTIAVPETGQIAALDNSSVNGIWELIQVTDVPIPPTSCGVSFNLRADAEGAIFGYHELTLRFPGYQSKGSPVHEIVKFDYSEFGLSLDFGAIDFYRTLGTYDRTLRAGMAPWSSSEFTEVYKRLGNPELSGSGDGIPWPIPQGFGAVGLISQEGGLKEGLPPLEQPCPINVYFTHFGEYDVDQVISNEFFAMSGTVAAKVIGDPTVYPSGQFMRIENSGGLWAWLPAPVMDTNEVEMLMLYRIHSDDLGQEGLAAPAMMISDDGSKSLSVKIKGNTADVVEISGALFGARDPSVSRRGKGAWLYARANVNVSSSEAKVTIWRAHDPEPASQTINDPLIGEFTSDSRLGLKLPGGGVPNPPYVPPEPEPENPLSTDSDDWSYVETHSLDGLGQLTITVPSAVDDIDMKLVVNDMEFSGTARTGFILQSSIDNGATFTYGPSPYELKRPATHINRIIFNNYNDYHSTYNEYYRPIQRAGSLTSAKRNHISIFLDKVKSGHGRQRCIQERGVVWDPTASNEPYQLVSHGFLRSVGAITHFKLLADNSTFNKGTVHVYTRRSS